MTTVIPATTFFGITLKTPSKRVMACSRHLTFGQGGCFFFCGGTTLDFVTDRITFSNFVQRWRIGRHRIVESYKVVALNADSI